MSEPATGDPPEAADYCERCHEVFDPSNTGPVVLSSGQEYEYFTETDPGNSLWCPGCWKERQREKHAEENHALSAFGGGSA